MIKSLQISEWRQFSNLEMNFDEKLTILTGANGAGKTTLLNILSNAFGWNPAFVSSFISQGKYTNSAHEEITSKDGISIGQIVFDKNETVDIILPKNVDSTYSIRYSKKSNADGLYISAHRPVFAYRKLHNIPILSGDRRVLFDQYKKFNEKYIEDEFRDTTDDLESGIGIIKSSLISLGLHGYASNEHVHANPEMKTLFEQYSYVLNKVLPEELGFEALEINTPEVLLKTRTGEFILDAVSGGIASIIDITWQLFMYADKNTRFTAIIDEPENHLHPKLQRDFLANIVECFPHIQFIIATHNPFMISAVRESKVYVLEYKKEMSKKDGVQEKVVASDLNDINRAGSSNDILREVLGVESSIPKWAEKEIGKIIQEYSVKEFNIDTMNELKVKLMQYGFGEFIPRVIIKVMESKNDQTDKGG